jgi:low affinity Fe/Cu permease
MTWYELFLFVHIAATVLWVGAGFLSLVLALTYFRDDDEPAMRRFLADQEWLAMKLFVPASMVVLVMGLALVIESDAWSFDQLWIVLGLIGFAATFVTGFFLIKPTSERIGQAMERDGGRITPQIRTEIRKLLVKARVDYVVLTVVILDMVAKPTGDNVVLLIVMAAVLVAGVGYIVSRLRAIDAEALPAAAPAS